MAKWKLTRQIFGSEEFTLSEGEKVTVGRGNNNIIILSSAVISRNHCIINVQNNKALITDLKSSNGVYVGTNKIPPNTPYVIEDTNVIGLGWTIGAPLVNINDNEKYVFKLVKEKGISSITNKIKYQSENETDDIESQIAKLDGNVKNSKEESNKSPVIGSNIALKRKIDSYNIKNVIKENSQMKIKEELKDVDEVINIISDSENETHTKLTDTGAKKPKLEPICEEKLLLKDNEIKSENELLEFEAFHIKQEYLGYDEPVQIDSESDSESEQWALRLSQSSPGKPFLKIAKSPKPEVTQEDSSYSQLDDFVCMNDLNFEEDEDDFIDDIISLPPLPLEDKDKLEENHKLEDNHELEDNDKSLCNTLNNKDLQAVCEDNESDEFYEDIISLNISPHKENNLNDEIDGFGPGFTLKQAESLVKSPVNESVKKAQMIEPIALLPKARSTRALIECKSKVSSSKHTKTDKSSSKKYISNSQKEERKKKLKEIAVKDKETELKQRDSFGGSKPATSHVKVTTSNRGAFLTAQAVVKPVKRKDNTNNSKDRIEESSPKSERTISKDIIEDLENKKEEANKSHKKKSKSSKHKDHNNTKSKSEKTLKKPIEKEKEARVPLKSLKPLTDGEESFSGKPVSKVGPMQPEKLKKKVRFSEAAPQVLEFEIEHGHKMKKTSLVKTTLVDVRQAPVFSLEKITLMKILRWNPQWLEEQLNNSDPPPILGHKNPPLTVFHSFVNHNQYVQLIGDLLLMEIWECLTIAYMKIRSQNHVIQMRIESLPPIPTQERCLELFSLSVNITVPSSGPKFVPRVGEVLHVTFGPENARNQRFFFVHNVRLLPSPPNNRNAFYSVALHATFTEKMMMLRQGEIMIGKTLAYINKELMLFEAMEYMAGSPLSDAILRPEPYHFLKSEETQMFCLKSQWTKTLNQSQLTAVSSSVSAALSDKPSIQMVQGPPGTGKSSVICAIVMTYFYNAQGKKQQNRGKLLICATSNAAVDGLVIRLLNLRQKLPKPERFRMVRVGREEAMHPMASNISSQQLAQRDLARIHSEQPIAPAGLNEEILHVEAKINMWKTAALDAKDPVRVAYCQGRLTDLNKRIALLRSGIRHGGGSEEIRPEQLAQTERRIIEGADIVLTTLASAQNYKMRGLKRRIALCIIDEAGQVIEPETLIPLTLDVTRLTLIGDPQQLPGFICSQRAKMHGLNESLFSRLSSCSEHWATGSPVVFLNQQYRMHPEISDYPSRAFYDGRIQTIAPVRPELNIPAYNIISIASGDKGQGISGANEMEAWGVSRLVIALDTMLRPHNLKIAVITPYNAHKELIKKNLRTLQQRECQVEVNTVDSFQGQERDVVVVSLARSQGVGFLTDAGRVNVMLTRARHALLICLNPHALLKNQLWKTLVEDAQRRNLYKVLPNKMCQPVTPAQVSSDDILRYIINNKPYNHSYR